MIKVSDTHYTNEVREIYLEVVGGGEYARYRVVVNGLATTYADFDKAYRIFNELKDLGKCA